MSNPNESFDLSALPLEQSIETVQILRQLNKASRALAELKGEAKTIPNENILINTLGLQEAKDSSAIENIITTNDELFRAAVDESYVNAAAKEVQNYISALITGFRVVRDTGLLTNRTILSIQQELERNNAGFRKLPGTVLKNNMGEVVYNPPQDEKEILDLMSNLELYINDATVQDLDPLIKMAIIHYQFESIHPFYDGNGRTGRIINILYLVKEGLLDIPVLYLSHSIIQHKRDYYRLLQEVRSQNAWEQWIMYMLIGVEETAYQTIEIVKAIRELMALYKAKMRAETGFYSKELLENLFRHPYTKIAFVEEGLGVHRNTAAFYLNQLTEIGLVEKVKLGRSNYYINKDLFELLRKGYAQRE
ncbi:MAG: Fic family protein [Saprospiraceae bacterium]|nr:Fic family protein [Saprospiraceae bacterium]